MGVKKMIRVLTILCVLVSLGRSQEPDDKIAPCDIFIKDSNDQTINCSRRNIEEIPDNWPENINTIDKDANVFITFFNNSISTLSQLIAVPGKRIAISFKSNQLDDIEDGAFSNIEGVVYLDLSNNSLSGDVLRSEVFQGQYIDGIYGDIDLETLNLGHNDIHSLDRYLFKYTPNLTRLYLNNNPIEILDHVTILALSSAINLKVLDLAKTDIDHIPLDAFRGLGKLQQIDLSNNRFVTVPESLSLVGDSLQYLTFNNNPIVELNDDSFVGLTNLIELEVGANDYLDEVKRSTFSPLKNLRVLHLCHNQNLRYISHNAFRGLNDNWTLKEVYLDDNNLSELSTDLIPWNKLEILGMSGNNWLCNCDLVDIIINQEAGTKFKSGEIPFCAAPMRFTGATLSNITLSDCPVLRTTFGPRKRFTFADLKAKHIIWSILGVAGTVCLGMILGLLVNAAKSIVKNRKRNVPIRYFNLNSNNMA